MSFFQPRWQHALPDIRLRAVESAAPAKLKHIAATAGYEDVFHAAVDRIAGLRDPDRPHDTDKAFYDLLAGLADGGETAGPLSAEAVCRRQEYLIGRIAWPHYLLKIVTEAPQKRLALLALRKLKLPDLVRYFDYINYVPQMTEADDGESEGQADAPWSAKEGILAIRRRFNACLAEAVAQGGGKALEAAAALTGNQELQRHILLHLPGREITPDLLRKLCVKQTGDDMLDYAMMLPFLRNMAGDGWLIQEDTMRIPCPRCGKNDIPGSWTQSDGASYGCGFCEAKGEIQVYKVTGRLQEKSFALKAIGAHWIVP